MYRTYKLFSKIGLEGYGNDKLKLICSHPNIEVIRLAINKSSIPAKSLVLYAVKEIPIEVKMDIQFNLGDNND